MNLDLGVLGKVEMEEVDRYNHLDEGLGATRKITNKIYYGLEPFSKGCKEFFENNISVR